MVHAFARARLDAGENGHRHGQQAKGEGEMSDMVRQRKVAIQSEEPVTGKSRQQKGGAGHGEGAHREFRAHHVKRSCGNHHASPPSANSSGVSLAEVSMAVPRRCWSVKNAAMNANNMAID